MKYKELLIAQSLPLHKTVVQRININKKVSEGNPLLILVVSLRHHERVIV